MLNVWSLDVVTRTVMKLNGLESLCGLDMWRSEEMMAKDIMQTKMIVVPCQATVG